MRSDLGGMGAHRQGYHKTPTTRRKAMEGIRIRDFIGCYVGIDGKQINFFCFDKGSTTVNIDDLFGTNKYDHILDKELLQWEYEDGMISIIYEE